MNLLYNRLKNSALQHIIIVGNHDWFNLECKEHSLEVLKTLSNVIVVDKPMVIDNMWFFPYIHDKQRIKDEFEHIKEISTDEKILLGHFDITLFDYGNGHVCSDGLDLQDFKYFPLVISGHFHKYQKHENVVYLGTPYSHSFGESNQIKYLGILNSETCELTLKESVFPKHITREIDCTNDAEFIMNQSLILNDTDIFRFVLKGPQTRIDECKGTFHSLIDTFNVKIIEKPTDISNNEVVIEETMNNTTQFEKWAKEIANLDESVINLGLEYLR